jgi:hypothetical protein
VPYETLVEQGMHPNRNLIRRSERCLECHVGGPNKFVDHEMIAAGHPDLTFDLSYFSFYMPQHWKTPEENNVWRSVQAWGVGQAVQLQKSLERLAWRAEDPKMAWPEYAELDCFACHHSLTEAKDSWRLTTKKYYSGRRPGNPPWNQARFLVFRDLLQEIQPGMNDQLDQKLKNLAQTMNQLNSSRTDVAREARDGASLAGQLAASLERQPYDRAVTLRVMQRIAADSEMIAAQGERPAEQAAMALDVFYRAYQQNSDQGLPNLRAPLDVLIDMVRQNPSSYSAQRFNAQMQKINEALKARSGAAGEQ